MKKVVKITFTNIKENYILAVIVLIVGLILGWIFFHSSGEITVVSQEAELHEEHDHSAEESTTWTCSMHPQIKQDKPGQCPICGMDLIPLTSMTGSGDDVDPDEIVMSDAAMKLASIQTIVVTRGVPEKTVFLQGKVQADERNVSELTARFGGRIEKLFINYTGQNVQKGEILATIYSPDLITAQRELLEAIAFRESRPSLYSAARGKLNLWNLTDEQISSIEDKGEPLIYFDILSPLTGTVTMRHVAAGDYVKEGTVLFKVVNLTNIWVMFDAYESDLPWIKVGDKVDLTVKALPGEKFTSRVTFIDPLINGQTRVAKVRVEVPNPKMALKPEMFSTGMLESSVAKGRIEILVPKSSVLWTGKRSIVYVRVPNRTNPSFSYREVTLGPEAGTFFVIAEGLSEGEEIATNGVFKIDAAAQLSGLPSMMNPEGGMISSVHNHGGTPMSNENIKDMVEQPDESAGIITDIHPDFKIQLGELVSQYLLLKDEFVNSNEETVEITAQKTLSALNNIDMTLLNGEAHTLWMKIKNPLEDNINSIIQMNGLEMKRSHFSLVSDRLSEAISNFGVHYSETINLYLEYCPMAFDNEGAYWISNSEEIRNPYFGDAMLTCGEVIEIINIE